MHIDIHAHFFNTRYLPLQGVAVKSRGIPPALARLIAWGITIFTPDDDSLEHDGSWFASTPVVSEFALGPEDDPSPLELTEDEAIDRFTRSLPERVVASSEFDEVVREARDARGLLALEAIEPPGTTDPQRREWLRGYLKGEPAAFAARAQSAATDDDAGAPGVGGYLQFLYHLTCREKRLADIHRTNSPGVGLCVHLMMDMEWPYEDEPVYGYSRAIRRVRRLCRQSGGRIVPFVAFDAYRPDSLRLVQDAVQHQSFVGVKFYAPSGYRPDTNTRTILARADVAPTELDRRCAALIEWCAGNDIPIMAHCTPQGMEVAPDQHSGFNAAPEFWEAWLAKLPDLRLCFAHAGGHGHWFPGVPDQKDRPPTFPWSTKIIELCTTNPNVYTDLSHMGDILGDEQAAFFARTLSEDLAANAGRPFSLSTKIVYGTDFPMPLPSGGWQHYYRRMMDTIRGRPELAPLEAGIFRNNAVVFLGLGNFIDQRGGDLTPEQKRHLEGYRDPGPKGSSGVGHVRRPSRPSPK